jgi:hypothetical protein
MSCCKLSLQGIHISKHVSRITKASFYTFTHEKICSRRIVYFAITNIASHQMQKSCLCPLVYVLGTNTFKLFFFMFWLWVYLMRVFQKRIERVKFDIYVFIHTKIFSKNHHCVASSSPVGFHDCHLYWSKNFCS